MRVKGGTIHRARRKKALKQAKGYFGSKHRLYKTAKEQVMHSGAYAYRDRKARKRDFRKLWITRINAACRLNEISYSKFIDGLNKLRQLNINVCVHIINGLPFETHEMMLTTAKEIGKLDIQALKIHMLYVIKNTKLNQMYQNNQFTMLTRDEYIDLVTEQLSYLPENIVIERLTGDGNVDDLVAPDWSIKKVTILNDIDKLMVKKNYVQGCNLVQK